MMVLIRQRKFNSPVCWHGPTTGTVEVYVMVPGVEGHGRKPSHDIRRPRRGSFGKHFDTAKKCNELLGIQVNRQGPKESS